MYNLLKEIRIRFSSDREMYRTLKNIFGFYPGNIFLYKLAFRHRSAATEMIGGNRISNERLEFLGDAILDAVVADYMFKKFPLRDEGFLTEMRSKVVSRTQLNKLCLKLGLNTFITAGSDLHSTWRSINGDAFEAFIGALYLDKGYSFTRQIIIQRIINVYFDMETLVSTDFNFKSKLIEWGQREKRNVAFHTSGETGTNHNRLYLVDALIDNDIFGQGQDFSIKGAEQQASEKALARLREENLITPADPT
ncbi:MAG: ribonuclease III [Bacteroidetes bacterium GWE2_42_24]|nr:MAG: ribonuclease III [Bacteroidetes bacterium GWE2_42_24]OFY27566.1 MAG: ribonuclease III [Bacteroidetes bacterium GWF2_43_11]